MPLNEKLSRFSDFLAYSLIMYSILSNSHFKLKKKRETERVDLVIRMFLVQDGNQTFQPSF